MPKKKKSFWNDMADAFLKGASKSKPLPRRPGPRNIKPIPSGCGGCKGR